MFIELDKIETINTLNVLLKQNGKDTFILQGTLLDLEDLEERLNDILSVIDNLGETLELERENCRNYHRDLSPRELGIE
jgi:hypothetical protein